MNNIKASSAPLRLDTTSFLVGAKEASGALERLIRDAQSIGRRTSNSFTHLERGLHPQPARLQATQTDLHRIKNTVAGVGSAAEATGVSYEALQGSSHQAFAAIAQDVSNAKLEIQSLETIKLPDISAAIYQNDFANYSNTAKTVDFSDHLTLGNKARDVARELEEVAKKAQIASLQIENFGTSLPTLLQNSGSRSLPPSSSTSTVETVGGIAATLGGAAASAIGTPLAGAAVAAGISGLTAGISSYAKHSNEAKQRAASFRDTLDQQTGAVTASSRAWVAEKLEARGTIEEYEALGGRASDLTEKLLGNTAAQERHNKTIEKAEQLIADKVDAGEAPYKIIPLRNLITAIDEASEAITKDIDGQVESQKRIGRASQENISSEEAHAAALLEGALAADTKRQSIERLSIAEVNQRIANGNLMGAQLSSKNADQTMEQVIRGNNKIFVTDDGSTDLEQSSNAAVEGLLGVSAAHIEELEQRRAAGELQSDIDDFIVDSTAKFDNYVISVAGATANLQAFREEYGFVESFSSAVIEISANTSMAEEDIIGLANTIIESKGSITLDANTNPAVEQIAIAMGLVEEAPGGVISW